MKLVRVTGSGTLKHNSEADGKRNTLTSFRQGQNREVSRNRETNPRRGGQNPGSTGQTKGQNSQIKEAEDRCK